MLEPFKKTSIEPQLDRETEERLLEACQRGSEDAFRQLFDRYHKGVLHLALAFSGNIQDAEDITQEVFVKVFRKIASFRRASSFYTWVYRITVNVCLDENRKRQRRQKHHAKVLDEHDLHEQGDSSYQEILRLALRRMKPKLRTVIILNHLQGLSHKEVAEIVGCAEGTVSSRLNRARTQLKKILSQMGVDRTYFQDS